MMKKILFVILITLILTACGGRASGSDTALTVAPVPAEYAGLINPLGAEAAAAGAEIFKTNCQACHGPQGLGDGPAGAALDPRPKNLAVLASTVGDDFLFWRVSAGKDGTAMIGWTGVLTDEQIWQVVAFIRTFK